MKRYWHIFLAILVALLLANVIAVGCGDDDDDDNDDSADDDVSDDDDSSVDDDDDDDNDDTTFDEAEQNMGQWTWVAVDGAICRDKEPTGLGVRLQDGADKLVIFLQGGGSCHDADSCNANPAHGIESDFDLWVTGQHSTINGSGTGGIFNADHADNPVSEWSFILVPYCTGDHHAGSAEDAVVDGVADPQQFVGYENLDLYMDVLTPYFSGASQVLLAGDSAGGMGVVLTYLLVAEAFAPVPVTLLDDSGPILKDDVFLPCWQKTIYELYAMDDIFPADCVGCDLPDNGGMSNLMSYLPQAYPDAVFGFYVNNGDEVFRTDLGEIQNDCQGGSALAHQEYTDAVEALRDDVLIPTGQWATFVRQGIFHTAVLFDHTFFDVQENGTYLTDWLGDLLNGTIEQVSP
jgi:Pectinacetylesterase